MKQRSMLLFVCCAAIVGFAGWLALPIAAADAKSQDVVELAESIAKLEARIAKLEELRNRVAELERTQVIGELERKKSALVMPRLERGQEQIPDDWQRRTFNGMRYYIVPLESGKQSSNVAVP